MSSPFVIAVTVLPVLALMRTCSTPGPRDVLSTSELVSGIHEQSRTWMALGMEGGGDMSDHGQAMVIVLRVTDGNIFVTHDDSPRVYYQGDPPSESTPTREVINLATRKCTCLITRRRLPTGRFCFGRTERTTWMWRPYGSKTPGSLPSISETNISWSSSTAPGAPTMWLFLGIG